MAKKNAAPKSHELDLIASELGIDPNDFTIVDFRSLVAQLKKLGLTSKKVDARRQKATRYMRRKVREYIDVLKGNASVFSVPPQEIAAYEASGHRTNKKNRKVVVPTPHGEKVKRVKPVNGVPSYEITRTSARGEKESRRVSLFKGSAALESRLIEWVRKLPPLQKGEYYAFRFNGYNSYQYFSGPDAKKQMIDYLMRYVPDSEPDDIDEEIMKFEFVTIDNPKAWDAAVQKQKEESRKRRNERAKGRRNEYFRRRRERMTEDERAVTKIKNKERLQKDAEYQKKKRAQRTPEQIAAEKEKSKARMQKSREKRRNQG
jgi:hypothetical protein